MRSHSAPPRCSCLLSRWSPASCRPDGQRPAACDSSAQRMRGSAGMPRKASREIATRSKQGAASLEDQVQSAVTWLKRHSTKATRDGMARYGMPSDHALGVSMADMKVLGKRLGTSHELAAALWDTGIYEARMVTSFVDDPALVTSAQMDRWCRDFDNWGICDTVCFIYSINAPRLAQGGQVARPSRGVRQARGLRAAGKPCSSRQGGRRVALSRQPAAHRARRRR